MKIYTTQNGKSPALQILESYAKEERRLQKKYPWFNIFYNWLVALIFIALIVSAAVIAVQNNAQRRADAIAEKAVAEYQAMQEAEEQLRLASLAAEKQSAEEIMKENARSLARLFYGIRNFEKKYGYTKDDFYTLARCVLNRVESRSYPDTIKGVIDQPDQWIAYDEQNPMLGNYYQLAYKILEDYQYEETKPVSGDYLWAEVGQDGVWLIDGFGSTYNRWNYGKGAVRVVKG